MTCREVARREILTFRHTQIRPHYEHKLTLLSLMSLKLLLEFPTFLLFLSVLFVLLIRLKYLPFLRNPLPTSLIPPQLLSDPFPEPPEVLTPPASAGPTDA